MMERDEGEETNVMSKMRRRFWRRVEGVGGRGGGGGAAPWGSC